MTNYKRDAEDKRNKFVAWQRIHDKKPTESSAKELALAKADYDQAKKQRKDAQARQAARSSQTLAKFPTETSSASAAARPCKREQNVGKARKEYLDKDLLATEARTKVLHLQLAATTLERRIDARPQEITRLQTEAQHADRHAIVLEREAQAAKAKLTKAEEYLLVGQARAKALKDKSATTIPSSTVPAVSEHGSTGIDHTEVSQGERIKTEVEDLTDLVDEVCLGWTRFQTMLIQDLQISLNMLHPTMMPTRSVLKKRFTRKPVKPRHSSTSHYRHSMPWRTTSPLKKSQHKKRSGTQRCRALILKEV